MKTVNWNKKIFAILLEQAKGVRSWRQFASDCDISYVQMRKLAQGTQENPPRPKLIHKIANRSFGEIDAEDLMFSAGISFPESRGKPESGRKPAENFADRYSMLTGRDKKTVGRFVDFLLAGNSGGGSEDDKQGD